jgi:NET1-associated nuclear protein 1 (U3 small nucleolar RNA-associated protein 17)
MSCKEDDLQRYKGLDLMPTFVAPSFGDDPEHDDEYSAYNKPGAIMAWLEVCHFLPFQWPS